MDLCRFLHPRGDVDRVPVDADGPLGVALLADDDLAAVHPDAEGRQNAELLEIRVTLLLDHAEHRVDRMQNLAAGHGFLPRPQCDQPIALVQIDICTDRYHRRCS